MIIDQLIQFFSFEESWTIPCALAEFASSVSSVIAERILWKHCSFLGIFLKSFPISCFFPDCYRVYFKCAKVLGKFDDFLVKSNSVGCDKIMRSL